MKRIRVSVLLLAVLLLLSPWRAPAAEARGGEGWSPLLVFRFGNIDAIDAEDGDLAVFFKSIRNDGRFIPPMRTLVGPEIRNPTFFGLVYEAWIEGVLLAPDDPGALERVWIFPVDNRDEYLTQLINQGLNEYEGMDEVSTLREADPDGNVRTWYLEWLPGNVAVFGANRRAVAAARRLYEENGAAAGLLAPPGGRFVDPDLTLRLDPARLVGWQDAEPGRYRWREEIDRLVIDLTEYWKPNAARARLIDSMADAFALWPRTFANVELDLWVEPEGVEWRLRAAGEFGARSAPVGQLDILRSLPDRAAAAYAAPVTPETFDAFVRSGASLVLGAAGGVVGADARQAAESLFGRGRDAGLREAAWAWVAPPAGRPELGGARLFVGDFADADAAEAAWGDLERAFRPRGAGDSAVDSPLQRVLSQLGWEGVIRVREAEDWTAEIVLLPLAGEGGVRDPVYDAIFAARRNGGRIAVVGGASRPDEADRAALAAYRASLARECVARADDGSADVRSAFTRVGPNGAGMAGIFSPVRFMQLVLVEAADWQPRSADQHEPLSTQLAREMLEYGAGDAWTASGVGSAGLWDVNGGMSWRSLSRLCAALGITESIGMEE